MARLSAAIVLALAIASLVQGHPGRTDANGGHYNRKTGTYHYHNGGPARPSPSSFSPSRAVTPERPAERPDAPPKAAETRRLTRFTWHGVDGEQLHRAAMSGVDAKSRKVRLTIAAGAEPIEVALEALSIADRAFALNYHAKHSEFRRTFRQWTSALGNHQVNAKEILHAGETLRLRRADNRIIRVEVKKLSENDRDYLTRLLHTIAPPPAETGDDPFGTVEAFTGFTVAPNHETSTNAEAGSASAALTHWLNPDSGVRHNSSCRWYANTKSGRRCTADEGRPCGICGG
jgi:hypothetical protein